MPRVKPQLQIVFAEGCTTNFDLRMRLAKELARKKEEYVFHRFSSEANQITGG
jgi:hypothetical protein